MTPKVWPVLAKGVLLESVRRKDLWVVAILGFLIVASAGALGMFGITGLESFAKDLATTVLSGFSTVLAIVSTARLIPEEIKNRTLYPLLARPISRTDLIIGKYLGAVWTSWISFLILGALMAVALVMFRVQFEPILLQYVVAKMMGLALVCAITLALTLWMTPSAATTMAFVVCFGSNMLVKALVLSGQTAPEGTKVMYQAVNAFIPQLGLFDLGGRASNTNWGPVPMWVLGALAVYLVLYAGAMLALGSVKLRKAAL